MLSAIASMARKTADNRGSDCAFLSHKDGVLTVRATDTLSWLTISTPCDGSLDAIQMNAAHLNDVVGKMRADDIKLATTGDGKLKLSAKGGASRTVSGVADIFPPRDAVAGVVATLQVAKLHEALAFVGASASDDHHRKAHLCGVHIHTKNGRYIAAAAYSAGFSFFDLGAAGEDITVTIASPTVTHLSKVTGHTVRLTVSERAVQFDWEGGTLIGARTTLDFVDYARNLTTHETYLSVRPAELLAAMNAVSPVAQKEQQSSSQIVRLALSQDGVRIEADSQSGQASEPLDAEWHGPDMTVGFISKRMKAALDGFGDDELRVEISDPGKPIVVRSTVRDDRVSVLMGVRL